MNKTTAWFYIAQAGALNSIAATNDLLTNFKIQLSTGLFILLNFLLLGIGVYTVLWRLSSPRKQYQKNKITQH